MLNNFPMKKLKGLYRIKMILKCFHLQYVLVKPYLLDFVYTLLLSYVLGKFLAWILPRYQWQINKKLKFSLNPGSFTIKEHVLITFMTVSCQPSKLIQQLVMQRIYFPEHKAIQPISIISYLISMQLLGFGLAGIKISN